MAPVERGVHQASGAIVHPSAASSNCSACSETFESAADLRVHWKSERHLYNQKQRGTNFHPLSQDAWETWCIVCRIPDKNSKDQLKCQLKTAYGPDCFGSIRDGKRQVLEPAAKDVECKSSGLEAASLGSQSSSGEEAESQSTDASYIYDFEDDTELNETLHLVAVQRSSPNLNASGSLQLANGGSACHRQGRHRYRRAGPRLVNIIGRGARPTLKQFVRLNPEDIQVALARTEGMKHEWAGVVGVSKACYQHTPKLDFAIAREIYDGGCKTNNERGHQCQGQGKRHQNAAVHVQPKKQGGKLAKWS